MRDELDRPGRRLPAAAAAPDGRAAADGRGRLDGRGQVDARELAGGRAGQRGRRAAADDARAGARLQPRRRALVRGRPRSCPGLARTTGGHAGPGGLRARRRPTRAPAGARAARRPRHRLRRGGQPRRSPASCSPPRTRGCSSPPPRATPTRCRGTCCTPRATAARRVSLVLNRVPADAREEVPGPPARDARRARARRHASCSWSRETALDDGLLPAAALAPVRGWLDALAADAQARGELVRRTLAGALDSPRRRGWRSCRPRALEQQAAAAGALRDAVRSTPTASALDEVDETVRSGSLLRGEVLARWHEVVGTGDLMRALESRVGRLRDRLRALVTGAPAADAELRGGGGDGRRRGGAPPPPTGPPSARRRAGARSPPGAALLAGTTRMDAVSRRAARSATEAAVRAWQGHVFELVRDEGAGKRTTARLASLGVNGAGLTVMIAVFAQHGRADRRGGRGGRRHVGGRPAACSRRSSATRRSARSRRRRARTCSPASRELLGRRGGALRPRCSPPRAPDPTRRRGSTPRCASSKRAR